MKAMNRGGFVISLTGSDALGIAQEKENGTKKDTTISLSFWWNSSSCQSFRYLPG
jgi:hypothetical protein